MISSTSLPAIQSESVCPPLSLSLASLGFSFVNNMEDSDFYIAFNHSANLYRDFIETGGAKANTVLLRSEPSSVYPAQYQEKIERLYGNIYTFGATTDLESKLIAWPYYYNPNPLTPNDWSASLRGELEELINRQEHKLDNWKTRTFQLTMVASNKVSSSATNNYQLRRRFAVQLPSSMLHVFGNLWDSKILSKISHRLRVLGFALRTGVAPSLSQLYGNLFQKYPTFCGGILNKHDVIRDSKFSLVIENNDSYVSEKLIDALVGGSIPIYFGGDFKAFGIPERSVVTGLNSVNEIVAFIECVSDQEVEERLSETGRWLESPDFLQTWFGDNVFDSLASDIGNQFRKMVK